MISPILNNKKGKLMYSRSRLTNAKNLTKRLIKATLGRDHLLFAEVKIPKVHLGTNYGGWFVAPGVLPHDRQPIVLSFGVGDDISFDIEMITRYNAMVYAFDPTPRSVAWLAQQTGLPKAFEAFASGVADHDGIESFSLPTVPEWGDYSVRRDSADKIDCDVKRISTVVNELKLAQVDIIKMDIEGSEYSVLGDFCCGTLRPTQILIEFHHGRDGIAVFETTKLVAKLRKLGYRIFDVSPWGREFSFVHQTAVGAAKQTPRLV